MVDAGVRGTHREFIGQLVPGLMVETGEDMLDPSKNYTGDSGTHAAGVIAAANNGRGIQGVAPHAKIMPLFSRISISGGSGYRDEFIPSFRHAAANNVKILNNGYAPVSLLYGYAKETPGARVTISSNLLAPHLDGWYGYGGARGDLNEFAKVIGNEDMVAVFAIGDNFWRPGGSVSVMGAVMTAWTPEYIVSNFVAVLSTEVEEGGVNRTVIVTATLSVATEYVINGGTHTISPMTLGDIGAGGYVLAPRYHPELIGKWLGVVAVDRNSVIAPFSNACGGNAKHWCLAAPGVSISSAGTASSDEGYTVISGSSAAAPHISGALALLKSRFPNMPMSVLVAILLNTADDLGEEGVDDVYGHGLVNVSAAINIQNDSKLVLPEPNCVDSPLGEICRFSPDTTLNVSIPNAIVLSPQGRLMPRLPAVARDTFANYGITAIGARSAHERNYWGQGVTVAVVDTGIATSPYGNEFKGRIVPGIQSQNAYAPESELDSIHGSRVAAIIGASQDDRGIMGVAPSVHLMPLLFEKVRNGEDVYLALESFQYAAENGVAIINNSWGTGWVFLGNFRSDPPETPVHRVRGPLLRQLFDIPDGVFFDDARNLRDNIKGLVEAIRGKDVVAVWGAGNHHWNENATRVPVCDPTRIGRRGYECPTAHIDDIFDNFVIKEPLANFLADPVTMLLGQDTIFTVDFDFTPELNGIYTISAMSKNNTGGYALAPRYHPELLGRWLAVVAVDISNNLGNFSDACGDEAKYWCLAAPGVDVPTSEPGRVLPQEVDGTSFSAPHISGALALLKNRFPNMPMSIIVAILLNTADDLGEPGVDEIFGHGMVNVSSAINIQSSSELVFPGSTCTTSSPIGTICVFDDSSTATVLIGQRNPFVVITQTATVGGGGVGEDRRDEFVANWGIRGLSVVDGAYQHGFYGLGVTIGVIVDGMPTMHGEFTARIVSGSPNQTIGVGTNGVFIAGIIGAARNGRGIHGVAPEALLMPLADPSRGAGYDPERIKESFTYAAGQDVPILNVGWNPLWTLEGSFERHGRTKRYYKLPMITNFLDRYEILNYPVMATTRTLMAHFDGAMRGKDMVAVWGAGDEGFSRHGFTQFCTSVYSDIGACTGGSRGFGRRHPLDDREYFLSLSLADGNVHRFDLGRTNILRLENTTITISALVVKTTMRRNGQDVVSVQFGLVEHGLGGYGLAPHYHPDLLGKWLAVAGVDSNLSIGTTSNGCGAVAKHWCLAAPGVTVRGPGDNEDANFVSERTGTQYAAAHVSGLLALLKNRFPNMPMSVLVAILLNTADDLGEAGVDSTYGHGMVNIGAAINVQNSTELVVPVTSACAGGKCDFTSSTLTITASELADVRTVTVTVSVITLSLTAPNATNDINHRDAEFMRQYGLSAIKADAAYQRDYYGAGATVGVVDSEIRTTHVEFAGRIVAGRPGHVNTENDHGTFVAGIIGAANDGTGMQGVAPSAVLMPLSFQRKTTLYNGGNATTLTIGSARDSFQYAAARNVHILNNSWGGLWNFAGRYQNNASTPRFFTGPILKPFMDLPDNKPDPIRNGSGNLRDSLQSFADILNDEDMVAVWSAGNEDWHEGGSVKVCLESDHENCEMKTTEWLISNYIVEEPLIDGATLSITMSVATSFTVNNIAYTVSSFSPNGMGGYALAPHYHPELLGRWLAVIAVDSNRTIASFSNGCGSEAKHWCLAAPGVGIHSTDDESDNDYDSGRNGTSFSAPHVSGALALLKSRLPNMPMSVLAAILLNTADDLGAAGVDDVYGHGMVNISAAINTQNNALIVLPDDETDPQTSAGGTGFGGAGNGAGRGLALPRGDTKLPYTFAAFADQLRDIKAAVRYLGDRYYDSPVKIDIAPRPGLSPMRAVDNLWSDGGRGDITSNAGALSVFARQSDGVLRSAGGKWRALEVRHNWYGETPVWGEYDSPGNRPFFFSAKGGRNAEVNLRLGDNVGVFAARGKEEKIDYNQFGFRLRKQAGRFHFASSFSEIREENTFLGGSFGGAMPLHGGGETRQAQLFAKMRLNGLFGLADGKAVKSGEWHAFGSYQHARAEAKLGGLVSEMSPLRAQGWRTGLSGRGVFSGGDVLRFAVGEDTSITGGRAVLRYARAANAQFDEDTQLNVNRGFRPEERVIEAKSRARLSWSAGYGFRPTEKSRLSFGINYTVGEHAQAGVSYRLDF